MRLKIGQRVVFIDDIIEGEVISIDDEIIEVKDDEGMIFKGNLKDVILANDNQYELSKFLDIDNPDLHQKMNLVEKKNAFKKDNENLSVMEVDLHIQHLVKSSKGMSNHDMLTLQLDTAKHKLEFAIRKRMNKIIFIHGVGEGVLKSELSYLCKRYPVDFYDASYQKYGLGATEVYIYQNKK